MIKMLIFRFCLLLLIRKTESALICLLKYGFGPKYGYGFEASIPVVAQPSGSLDLGGCRTRCEKMVKGLLMLFKSKA